MTIRRRTSAASASSVSSSGGVRSVGGSRRWSNDELLRARFRVMRMWSSCAIRRHEHWVSGLFNSYSALMNVVQQNAATTAT